MSLLSVLCWRLCQSGSLVEDLVSDAPEPVISDSPSDFYLCLPVFLVSFLPGFVLIVISLSVFLSMPPTSCGFLHTGERHQARIKLCFLRCVGLVLSEILWRERICIFFPRLSSFLAHLSKDFCCERTCSLSRTWKCKTQIDFERLAVVLRLRSGQNLIDGSVGDTR